MHTLDMVVASVDLYDEVAFTPDGSRILKTEARSALAGFDSPRFCKLIDIACEKYLKTYDAVGGTLEIIKNIPLGAGLGGSSAAIAGAIRLLDCYNASCGNKKEGLDNGFLLGLGSDVPYMYQGGFARVKGVGEIVEPLRCGQLHFLVVTGEGGVDSKHAYDLFDEVNQTCPQQPADSVKAALKRPRNDLERAAFALNPSVSAAKRALEETGAEFVLMSGSGSAVSAVFKSRKQAERAMNALRFDGEIRLLKSVEY